MRFILLALLAAASILVADLRSQADTKALADGLVHELRALQNEDGTYGSGIEDTCKVLDLLSRCPRRYNELDGPFFRKAADAVLAADKLTDLDGWRALALAGCVGDAYASEREVLVGRLLKRAERDWGKMSWSELFALNRIVPDQAPRPPQHIVNFGNPALRVLCGIDPTRVPPPRLRETKRWVRWATAARLRGVEVDLWPDAPAPREGRSLDELLLDLEHTIAVHGLKAPGDEADGAGGEREDPPVVDEPRDRETALRASLQWLRAHQDNGTFGLEVPGWEGPEPGVTALLLSATQWTCAELGEPVPAWVDQGLDWLTTLQDADGAIALYGVRTYTTSVAMEALIDGERDPEVVARALEFLRTVQADEGEGYDADIDPHYGGVGYGGDERPDLSNTQMAVEAARRAGLDVGDEFFQKAMIFLERNHNLGEARVDEWPRAGGGTVVSGTDGGATYMPGNSPAGEDEQAEGVYVARSYGSMTYALTKSYLLCGLPADSPRVQAAVRWLADNFTLETNPGFSDPGRADDGLYYYYMAMARTLSRLPDSALVTSDGRTIAWRDELVGHLLANQRVDGTWINPASARWYEGSPALCTAYALLTLKAADA